MTYGPIANHPFRSPWPLASETVCEDCGVKFRLHAAYGEPAPKPAPAAVAPRCCEAPKPRIGTMTGRIFCGSCRQYLDRPQAGSEPLRDVELPETSIAPSEPPDESPASLGGIVPRRPEYLPPGEYQGTWETIHLRGGRLHATARIVIPPSLA